jgi:hypothetical protein
MAAELAHRHGGHIHAHPYHGPHRHLLRPRRSAGLAPALRHEHGSGGHGHSHGLVDDSIKRSRAGVRAVVLALAVLGIAAAGQAIVFAASGSIALLADLIHNVGDAATAIPLGIAFALRSERAERVAGHAVVLAIFFSACVAGYEAVDRLVNPQDVRALGAVAGARARSGSSATGSPPRSGPLLAGVSRAPR